MKERKRYKILPSNTKSIQINKKKKREKTKKGRECEKNKEKINC